MRDDSKALGYIMSLVNSSISQGLLTERDRIASTNLLIGVFGAKGTPPGIFSPTDPNQSIKGLMEFCRAANHPWAELNDEKFTGRVMGLLTPRPSWVQNRFKSLLEDEGPEGATKWFYDFSTATKDVRLDLAARDLKWTVNTSYGDLQITVNRSKPEKDPRDIAAKKTSRSYPKCLLCLENEGFWSVPGHPERSNHRVISIHLDGEEWFFQYSPYVYYRQHCIVFSKEHRPMSIGEHTVPRILDFLDMFPNFFLGSNASLPIVGGSILEHDHFQGGNWDFPIQKALCRKSFKAGPVVMESLIWPLSTLRLKSQDRKSLQSFANKLIYIWQSYDDEENGILSGTDQDGERISHNSLSVIGRKKGPEYEIDMILRNNRTTGQFPDGMFHIRPSRHHIKKENIGLIEAMGLAVLPGRLAEETLPIRKALSGSPLVLPENSPHRTWAQDLLNRHGTGHSDRDSMAILEKEIGTVFLDALKDCAVYRDDEKGRKSLDTFAALVARSI